MLNLKPKLFNLRLLYSLCDLNYLQISVKGKWLNRENKFWSILFELFPTWASNIKSNMGIEEDIFSKTKKTIQNLARWKKLTFSWCFWSFRFSLYLHCMPQVAFALHNERWSKWRTLKQLNQRETNQRGTNYSLMLLLSI